MGLSSADLREIKSAVINVFNEKFMKEIADKVADMVEKRFEDRINHLEERIGKLETTNSQLKKMVDIQEQSSRNSNLRIFGFPVASNEDLRADILGLFTNKLKVNIADRDMIKCHRVGSKNASDKPPAVLVRFANDSSRIAVLKARKHSGMNGIQIREDLTQTRLALFKEAIRRFTSRNAWVLNGIVFVKHKDAVHRLADLSDLSAMK